MTSLKNFKKELRQLANPTKALTLQRFFKTGKGEYGEGDRFLGITVPLQRKLVQSYVKLNLKDLKILLRSKLHEERLSGLLILVKQYQQAEHPKTQEKIFKFYLQHTKHINNWDLVDLTAYHIVGHYLFDKEPNILYQLAKSRNLWERRIAIVATYYFIRQKSFQPTLTLAAMLLQDHEDLLHKACGWMLRELGKRDLKILEAFLQKHYQKMPRTMLRYTIEKFPQKRRKEILEV